MRIVKSFVWVILVGVGLCLVSSCGHERVGCEGEIIVQNTIPDTTLYVDEEPFFRDLFAKPAVLKHTEGRNIILTVRAEDGTVVDAIPARSPTTGRLNAVKIVPLKKGATGIQILAEDGCGGKEISFNVTVKDTTQ